LFVSTKYYEDVHFALVNERIILKIINVVHFYWSMWSWSI